MAANVVERETARADDGGTVAHVADQHVLASRAVEAHRWVARVLLGGLAVQLFFAGLGVFGVSSFVPHMILGTVIILASFALPVIAWRGHLGRRVLWQSWVLVGLMLVQGLLIDVGRLVPIVAALHPVNAMLLVLVTFSLATRPLREVQHKG